MGRCSCCLSIATIDGGAAILASTSDSRNRLGVNDFLCVGSAEPDASFALLREKKLLA
ncbi:hypothetical protein [Propionivibrio sp.]|uniref:hypothetical protein n=1 Tax=Propionivibrio sp. TaxID=2212460 RepID=UPI0025F56829|nr:hypothetical protein [Propionivibrio sp.]MBK8401034.1 hypothetical protein [Propionivibrio sp.]